jgi:hypothetical protein
VVVRADQGAEHGGVDEGQPRQVHLHRRGLGDRLVQQVVEPVGARHVNLTRQRHDTASGTDVDVDTPLPGLLRGHCPRPSFTIDRAGSRAVTEAVVP